MSTINNNLELNSAIAIYLTYVDTANELGKVDLVNRANEVIKRDMFNSDIEYYTELTKYILNEL